MGGGSAPEVERGAHAQEALNRQTTAAGGQMLGRFNNLYGQITPFATSRMKSGLPFFNSMMDYSSGTNAQAFQPAYGALNRRLASMGPMPSGFRTQAFTDLDAQKARSYDEQLRNNLLMNEAAKTQGAGMLMSEQDRMNPLGWTNAATQGNQVVMGTPASPGVGGMLGGAFMGGLSRMPF